VDIFKAGQGPVGLSTSSVLSIVCGDERSRTIRSTMGFAPDDTRSSYSGPVNGPFQITSARGDRQTAIGSLGDKEARSLQTAMVSERGDAQ
jgi:secreted trypsin-like serine protease